MKHIKEITLILNQYENSYERLKPGFEAPVYNCWGRRNRSVLIRIPHFKNEQSARIELRSSDPACNPYLAFLATLAAGMEGIKEKAELPFEFNKNIFELSEKERCCRNIEALPSNLTEALEHFKHSWLMEKTLGKHIFNKLIEIKSRKEILNV